MSIGTVKRCPIILIDRSVNAGIVGFRGSTQPTGGNPTNIGRLVGDQVKFVNELGSHRAVIANTQTKLGVQAKFKSHAEQVLIEWAQREGYFIEAIGVSHNQGICIYCAGQMSQRGIRFANPISQTWHLTRGRTAPLEPETIPNWWRDAYIQNIQYNSSGF